MSRRYQPTQARRPTGHVSPMERIARDRAILAAHQAGQSQERIAKALGMSPSGVSRALSRLDARLPPEATKARALAAHRRTGRKPIWPDCPPHLERTYRAVRAVIGSAAAREQLLAIEARRQAASHDSIMNHGGAR